jgi:transposase
MVQITLGIDISKSKFDVSLFDGDKHKTGQFSNDQSGFQKLSRWLDNIDAQSVPAAMEATGRYWEKLALYLYNNGHAVSVLNPKIIKKYGESRLNRNKTDRSDAMLIARYLLKEDPYLWEPPAASISSLKALNRHLNGLIEKRTRATNQLKAGKLHDFVRRSLEKTINFLDQEIKETETEINTLREQDDELEHQFELLTSIPGVGIKTAAAVLAELPDWRVFTSSKQLVAYAGLSPRQLQSGTKEKTGGIIKLGNKRLRKALYFAAVVGKKHNPILYQLAQRLLAREQVTAKMTVIAACMRKLLVLIYGILKSGVPFDPNYCVNVRCTA